MVQKRSSLLERFEAMKWKEFLWDFASFVTPEEKGRGINNPRIFQKSVDGHRNYVERIRPDFVKIMSDGFSFIQVMSIVLRLQAFRS